MLKKEKLLFYFIRNFADIFFHFVLFGAKIFA